MNPSVTVHRDAPLRARNTFGIAVDAPLLVEVLDAKALPGLFASSVFEGASPLVLGGGSNLLFVEAPSQPLLALTGRRARRAGEDGERVRIKAEAGVDWHGFVMSTLDRGLAGLENLALIPGTVGAAPIQNIGAYGVEVRESVVAVHAYEPASGRAHRLSSEACAFAYRDSLFKREPDRFIVTAVEFELSRNARPRLEYAGIREALAARGIDIPGARDVAEAVIALRQRKLPDPAVIGNAGSFFKNPIVPTEFADALKADHPALPVFASGDDATRKLSAAWLIDACGWKGHREQGGSGDAGVSADHALVLVNHGRASGRELFDLARRIADSVFARFGVALEPEPRIIGATWTPPS